VSKASLKSEISSVIFNVHYFIENYDEDAQMLCTMYESEASER
jgi:hypothetical protein